MNVNKIMTYVLGALAIFIIVLLLIPVAPKEGHRNGPKIIVFGDSLVAGYDLPAEAAFTPKLQQAFDAQKIEVNLIGMGVSGDTTQGGLDRLNNVIAAEPVAVILELGANDMLRGIPPDLVKENLDSIITRLKEKNIAVFLAGMQASPTAGSSYQTAFNRIYVELAQKHELVFYHFFLDGVAGEPALNLPDGIHPNEKGVEEIVSRIYPSIFEFYLTLQEQQQEQQEQPQ